MSCGGWTALDGYAFFLDDEWTVVSSPDGRTSQVIPPEPENWLGPYDEWVLYFLETQRGVVFENRAERQTVASLLKELDDLRDMRRPSLFELFMQLRRLRPRRRMTASSTSRPSYPRRSRSSGVSRVFRAGT